MIENKILFERMAAEWVKEFMFSQREFEVMDIIKAMPLKHLGIDFDKVEFGDKQKEEVWDVVENCIKTYAPRYGYKNNGHNVWKQSNAKPEPSFEVNITGGNVSDASFTVISEENWDDCNGVLPELEEKNFSLVDPFENYVRKMRALLGADPDVTVLADKGEKVINIAVAGCTKPDAYRVFFQGEREIDGLGKIKFLVNGHGKSYKTKANIKILKEMLANHPLVKDIVVSKFDNGAVNRIFVVFKNTTVQYKNDNWGSPWNVSTTTPELLAKEVMKGSGLIILWTTDSDMALASSSPENNN